MNSILASACVALVLITGCAGGDQGRVGIYDAGTHVPTDGGGSVFGDAGKSNAFDGSVIGRNEQPLNVHVEDIKKMTIDVVTVQCAGDCADVEAVAHDGNPPYAFKWEDGSTAAKRHVCPSATTTYSVTATDTAIDDPEFMYLPAHAAATVTAKLLDCPVAIDAGACDAASDASLPGARAPEELTPDILGMPTYFAGGAALPAGHYRITYVDGCVKYDATWFWTVQGAQTFQYELIANDTSTVLGVLPGTAAPIGFGVGGGYANYADCVAANRMLAPLDFEFAGGKLGIWQNDFQPGDNTGGDKSPTWRLSTPGFCR